MFSKIEIINFKIHYNAITTFIRVVYALILREARTTFGDTRVGYIWAILAPALGVGLLVLIFSAANRLPPFGQSLALFFATGFLTYEFYAKLTNSLMTVLDANKALLVYPVVTPFSTILSRAILITLTYFLIMVLFNGVLILLGLSDLPSNPIKLVLAFLAISFYGSSFGVLCCAIYSFWNTWKIIFSIIHRPLFFISGIFFIPSSFSDYVLKYLTWNPVMHLIEFYRVAYYPNYESRIVDIRYVVIVSIAFTMLGLLGERISRSRRV